MGSIHDCSICFNSFNDHKNRPLILPCGHTFCKACFQREQRGGASQCFLDRKAFPAVSKLTTNFILLQTEVRRMRRLSFLAVWLVQLCEPLVHVAEQCWGNNSTSVMLGVSFLWHPHQGLFAPEPFHTRVCSLCCSRLNHH